MKISIKTKSPQAHLETCVLIQHYASIILEHKIGKKNSYGFFLIDTAEDSVDSFILVENSVVNVQPLAN